MTLPTSWQTVRVFGAYKRFDTGEAAHGAVTFEPVLVTAPEGAGRTVVLPKPRTVTLDVAGKIDIQLPATDDPDIAPTGWAYRVTEKIGRSEARAYFIHVPLAGGDIDLATAPQVVPPENLVSYLGLPAVQAAQASADDAEDSATAAAASAGAAAASASAADSDANAAAASAAAASAGAAAAAASASAAAASASAADSDASAAAASAAAASAGAAAAATSEGNAAASATSATTQAASATASATNAGNSAMAADGSADAAAASAGAATASANAAAASIASGAIYPDTATGLAAVSEGGYFSVPSASSAEYLILYRDVGGVATEVKRYPSAAAVAPAINLAAIASGEFSVERTSDNLFNPATVTAGTYFNTTTGVLSASAGFFTSDFIPVEAGKIYKGVASKFGQWDAAKAYIGEFINGTATAANAAYIRLYSSNATLNTSAALWALNYTPAFDVYATDTVLTPNLADGSVPLRAMEWARTKVTSTNLYDSARGVVGMALSSTGDVITSGTSTLTHFIPVEEGVRYSRPTAGTIAFYDGDYRQLSISTSAFSAVSPAGAAYMRTAFANSMPSVHRVYRGAPGDAAPYSEGVEIPGLVLSPEDVLPAITDRSRLSGEIAVDARNIGYLTHASPNLFDRRRAYEAAELNIVDVGGVISVALLTNVSAITSELIAVAPSTLYKISGYRRLVQFDVNGVAISKETTALYAPRNFTTAANAAYVQFDIPYSNFTAATFMLTVDAEWPATPRPYEQFFIPPGIRHQGPWDGKKILWMGTSIPHGGGYPEAVCAELGATLTKITKSGGRARAFKEDGSWETQAYLQFQFSLSQADVDARYGPNLGKEVSSTNYLTLQPGSGFVLTQAHIDALVEHAWEAKLLPNIADTDLFVIDYGINDRNGQTTYPFRSAESAGYDRKYFTGAMNFIIKKIYDERAALGKEFRVAIVTHHTRGDFQFNADDVVNAQIDVAKRWGGELINLADSMGVSDVNIARLTTNGDGLHFASGSVLSKRVIRHIVERLKAVAP